MSCLRLKVNSCFVRLAACEPASCIWVAKPRLGSFEGNASINIVLYPLMTVSRLLKS